MQEEGLLISFRMMRLDKYLSDLGIGTRKDVRKIIKEGRVSVGSVCVTEPAHSVLLTDLIKLDDETLAYEEFSYIMLNKPAGYLSASQDSRDKTVLDLLKAPVPKGLFPAGRLDKDTHGLVLLTNDGILSHRLLSPKRHVDKTYFVQVDGTLSEKDIAAFADGMALEDFVCLPAKLEILKSNDSSSDALVTIHEGKFHQIKRMFLRIDREVLYLKRLSIGPLILDPSLNEGEYRRLTPEEISSLKSL